jgi:hypothetical protein
MCSLLGVSRAASLTFTHSPGPTSRPFETGLLVFPFLVGSLRREDGCPIHDGGDDEEEDGFPLTTGGNNGGGDCCCRPEVNGLRAWGHVMHSHIHTRISELQFIKGAGHDVVIMFRHAACCFHHLIVFSQRRTISTKRQSPGLYDAERQPRSSCRERRA